LLEAVDRCSPADTMFANEIRLASLKALAKYNFQEGMKVSLTFANSQSSHGSESRTGEIMKLLLSYGRAAQPMIPDLEKLITTFEHEEDFPDWAKKQKIDAVKSAIEALRATEEQPKLRSLETKGKPQSKRTAKTGAR
jgi:hypothetical protein